MAAGSPYSQVVGNIFGLPGLDASLDNLYKNQLKSSINVRKTSM